MSSPTQTASAAVTVSQKYTDEKIADLQRQIDELKELVKKMSAEKEESLINCRRCGRNGHWTVSCTEETDVHGVEIDDGYESEEIYCDYCERGGHTEDQCGEKYDDDEDIVCYRCDRPGHYANECSVKKDACGHELDGGSDDDSE